jgi:hypothetical protein
MSTWLNPLASYKYVSHRQRATGIVRHMWSSGGCEDVHESWIAFALVRVYLLVDQGAKDLVGNLHSPHWAKMEVA